MSALGWIVIALAAAAIIYVFGIVIRAEMGWDGALQRGEDE